MKKNCKSSGKTVLVVAAIFVIGVASALLAGGQGIVFEQVMTGEVSIVGKATAHLERRIFRDLSIRRDMTAVNSFCFDMRISDPEDFSSYACYFKSGNGWYVARLELPEDAVSGGWYAMMVKPNDMKTEGNPSGWRNVEAIRIAGYRSTTNAVSITLRNVGFDIAKPEAYVIGRGKQSVGCMRKLEELGVDTRLIVEDDLVPGILDGASFVVLPCGIFQSDANAIVHSYEKSGGKILKCDKRLLARNELLEEVERVRPGVRARFAERLAAERVDEERMLAAMRTMPPRSGERRLIWCHSAWGMGGTNDWESTCRFLKKNGFTDLLVNLAWGGYAYYPSRVLPQVEAKRGDALEQCRAACRKHGIKMHVWKVCWNMGSEVAPEFVQSAKDAGRVQRSRESSFDGLWNCPSDPYSQQLEIDAMTELALEKKVDGIHFDYIRYPNADCCFCDGCRKRFEAKLGHSVPNWPSDTQTDEAVASAWMDFRCANISHVVKTVHERVRAATSNVEISAAVFIDPMRDPEVVGQEWVRWCAEGWLNFVCPMDYIKSPRMYAKRIAHQHDVLRKAGSKAKLYPGMAIMCSLFVQPLSPLSVAQEIAAVRAVGLDGFAVFSLYSPAEKVLPMLREGPLSPIDIDSPVGIRQLKK